jgi:hypothetical protein
MPLSPEQLELLSMLDDDEWRSVGYRMGNFHPWMAHELVREGLAEVRERLRKPGAHVFRRTALGRAALDEHVGRRIGGIARPGDKRGTAPRLFTENYAGAHRPRNALHFG